YTARGKWMDGWETRRRRTPGHDWCIVRLGLPGIICGIVVDTSFFRGNYPERVSLEGCDLGGQPPYKAEKKKLRSSETKWVQIFWKTVLKGDSQNLFSVDNRNRFTHLRLSIYPDGGVARLRVHGEAVPNEKRLSEEEVNLAGVENGGSVVVSSDQFFGAPRNLLMPGAAKNMGDGWETKRRRGPGNDWAILKLGVPGAIQRIEVDTAHFKGNFPDSCSLEACYARNAGLDAANAGSQAWEVVLPKTKLKANSRHAFDKLRQPGVATHVRFQIYPDGGVSRLRVFGRAVIGANPAKELAQFHHLPRLKAIKVLLDCCGARKWAERMVEQRPFANLSQVFEATDRIWAELEPEDLLEAFRHHPAIGGKRAKTRQSSTARQWSAKEQSATQKAAPEVLKDLAAENKAYVKKFGYVFLICATGKTSEEILIALRQRMPNDPEMELRVAAEEQRKITLLRLEKLLGS
ncbi:MAG: allantoicase, partial [Candidatus Acidiferrum sp.]